MIRLQSIVSFLALALVVAPQVGRPQVSSQVPTLTITSGRGTVVDSPTDIRRVAISNGEIAEAIVATPTEVLVNGKAPGKTTMVVWHQNGSRLLYNLTILRDSSSLDAVRREIQTELPGQAIGVDLENDVPIVHGTANDLT